MLLRRASYFAAISIGSFAALFVYALAQIVELDRGLRQEISESTFWAVSQASLEAQRLLLAVERASSKQEGGDAETIELRFEILQSRLTMMREGQMRGAFDDVGAPKPYFPRILTLMEQLDTRIFSGPLSDFDLVAMQGEIEELTQDLHEMTTLTALKQRVDRYQRRLDERRMMQMLLLAVGGIFVSGVAMSALLLRNVRRLRRTTEELADQQKHLEARVRERTVELQSALEFEKRAKAAYQSFVVTVSHQFRTPVSIINMIAQRQLRSQTFSDPEVLRKKFATILDSSERLEKLVGDFLTQASIETIESKLVPLKVDLDEVVSEAIAEAKEKFPDRIVTYEHKAVAVEGGVSLEGDPDLLRQAVLNLLSNALRYSEAPAEVSVKIYDNGVEKFVTVTDAGCGIPVQAQGAIFDKYFRAVNVQRLPGVGVGLSRVKEIMAQHCGTVRFRSAEGKGSEFTLVLPLKGSKFNAGRASSSDNPLYRG